MVNGYADLLLNSAGDKAPAGLREIRNAGEKAVALTRWLVSFSRKRPLEPRVLDLNSAVRDVARMIRPLMGEHIELTMVLEPVLGRVRADEAQICQVLMNLVLNARDAMPAGGRVIVQTANMNFAEAGSFVRLSVSDTGVGMDEATRDSVFVPFFTTKEEGDGVGLGMSIVQGIVEQSGGRIAIGSEPGKGTTVAVFLPRVEALVDLPDLSFAPLLGELRGTETVLVVDDQEDVARLVAAMLESCGYRALYSANGEQALRLCQRQEGPIHLVIADLVMPGISSAEFAGRLRQVRPGAKVLFMSGYSDAGDSNSPDFLPKPFTPQVLARKVRECLEAGRP